MAHTVEKRADARERFARYVIPTLERPFEVYLTQYADGTFRERYIGLFQGPNNLLVVARVNRDGSLLWNFMQAADNRMNRQRVGELVWPRR